MVYRCTGYLSYVPPGRIKHKFILMWGAMHESKLMCGSNKNSWPLLAFPYWSASDAERLTQLCKAGKARVEGPQWSSGHESTSCHERRDSFGWSNIRHECCDVFGWWYADVVVVKLATAVEGDQKALFSIATTSRCRRGCYFFPWIAPLYPWYVPYICEC